MADERLIPAGIRDDSNLAFNELIDRMGTVDLTPLLIYLVDEVEAAALPHLAEQFDVTGYKGWIQATSEGERRALIKSAIAKHYYKGTPYAIKKVLSDISIDASVVEWWQYGADPYHFKVAVELYAQSADAAKIDMIDKLIQEYKNVRSKLDTIEINYTLDSKVPVAGLSINSGEIINVFPQDLWLLITESGDNLITENGYYIGYNYIE